MVSSSSSLDGVRARLMFKLILVGDSGAGKSCLMRAFHAGTFNKDSESTIGVDFCTKKMRAPAEVEGEPGDVVKVQVWDTAGHERFHSITSAYFRNASGCMVVCDATRPPCEARRSVEVWTEAVRSVTPDALFVHVCSKCDLVADPSSGEALSLPGCMRASAKTGEGVAEAFDALVARVYKEKALPALRGGRATAPPLAVAQTPPPRRNRVLATGVTLLEDGYPLSSSSSSSQTPSPSLSSSLSEGEARCPSCSLM